jgi:cation:H+ antiporter
MKDVLILMLGVVCAGIGGELFLYALVRLARWARISAGIVATTIAAFATSSPELTIAITSALAGAPEISLGDALGSNVVNVALILGLALLISPIPASRETSGRDLLAAAVTPLLIGILAFDRLLSRLDGLLLLAAFAAWLVTTLVEVRRQRRASRSSADSHGWRVPLTSVAGLALLALAGRLVVRGAEGIAEESGVHVFVIGATLVALGTSVPELAIAVVSQLRRRHDIGLGTVLGSNIFNAYFIIGVAATICPIRVVWREVSWPLLFGAVTVAVVASGRRASIGRMRGLLLVALYAFYVALLLAGPGASSVPATTEPREASAASAVSFCSVNTATSNQTDRVASSGRGSTRQSTASPPRQARTDAESVPTFAAEASGSSPKASSVTNRAMVKPMPPSRPAPTSAPVPTPAGNAASPSRTATSAKSAMPMGLPISRPSVTAKATRNPAGSPSMLASSATPAFASAKIGITPKATHGCS